MKLTFSLILRSFLLVAVAFTSIALLITIAFSIERTFIFDTVLVHPKPYEDFLTRFAGLFFVLVIVSLIAWMVFGRWFSEKPEFYRSMMILVIILVVGFCSLVVSIIRIVKPSFEGQSIDQKMTFSNHVYHLITYSTLTGDVDLHFFECNADDIICLQIHQSKFPWFDKESRKLIFAKKILVTNPAANTVTLQIDGESVYVHQVK